MVLTPTQRDHNGEVLEGLSGSTKSVVCVERSVKNLGGPGSSWRIGWCFWKPAHEIRIFSHIRGNPGTEVCRTLSVVEDAS